MQITQEMIKIHRIILNLEASDNKHLADILRKILVDKIKSGLIK